MQNISSKNMNLKKSTNMRQKLAEFSNTNIFLQKFCNKSQEGTMKGSIMISSSKKGPETLHKRLYNLLHPNKFTCYFPAKTQNGQSKPDILVEIFNQSLFEINLGGSNG